MPPLKASGAVELSEEEIKRACAEFVERQGYTVISGENLGTKVFLRQQRDGNDWIIHTATVYIEVQKK